MIKELQSKLNTNFNKVKEESIVMLDRYKEFITKYRKIIEKYKKKGDIDNQNKELMRQVKRSKLFENKIINSDFLKDINEDWENADLMAGKMFTLFKSNIMNKPIEDMDEQRIINNMDKGYDRDAEITDASQRHFLKTSKQVNEQLNIPNPDIKFSPLTGNIGIGFKSKSVKSHSKRSRSSILNTKKKKMDDGEWKHYTIPYKQSSKKR